MVERPINDKVIDNRWVFRIKRDGDGKVAKYKTRLVAKGFQQTDNFDFSEIYSPVARLETLRILLAVANQKRLKIHQMDVQGAFLYGNIEEEVYMEMPQGLRTNESKVCRLRKSIYGLKKSPRYWNDKINQVMEKLGFVRSKNDYCMYCKVSGTSRLYISIYVDDLLIVGSDESEIAILKEKLSASFKVKDFGSASNYLDINIKQNLKNDKIEISQTSYLKNVLRKFGMSECKPVSIPMDPKFDCGSLKIKDPEIRDNTNYGRRNVVK